MVAEMPKSEGFDAVDGFGSEKANGGRWDVFDAHCHLAFAKDPALAADALLDLGVGAFCATVTPSEYESAVPALAEKPGIEIGIGLHPWWVADGRVEKADFEAFERLSQDAAFFGEVGLDFSKRFAGTELLQTEAFGLALRCFVRSDARAMSIHASRAERRVLDMLEDSGACEGERACILHWYNGPHDELMRAVEMGCFFSVGARMLATKRGRAYAAAIPRERLLLESDLPSRAGEPWSAAHHARVLREAVCLMEEVRGEPLAESLACAAARLFCRA